MPRQRARGRTTHKRPARARTDQRTNRLTRGVSATACRVIVTPCAAAAAHWFVGRRSGGGSCGHARLAGTSPPANLLMPLPRHRTWLGHSRSSSPETICKAKLQSLSQLRLDQSQIDGFEHGPRAVAHAELRQHAGDVVLHRAIADVEELGDLLVAVAAGEEAEDCLLAIRERLGPVGGVEASGATFQGPDDPCPDGRL